MNVSDDTLRALVAQSLSAAEVAIRTGLKRKTVLRRVKDGNLGEWTSGRSRHMMKRQVPDDFAERARQYGFNDNHKFYGCHYDTLKRWYAETGIPQLRSKREKNLPAPEGFEAFARIHSQRETMRHFDISRDMVRTFEARMGIARTRFAAPVSPSSAPARLIKPDAFRTAPLDRVQRDMSPAGQAADVLRRDRWTVFRCDDRGRYAVDGPLWRCGSVVCGDDELIERAERAARRMAA